MPDEGQEDTMREAAEALERLLDAAGNRLSELQQPVVVAACLNKFDDTGRYPDWLGVQVGSATWERTDYRLEGGDMLENARNPDEVVVARDVLAWLQDNQWRSLFARATGYRLTDEAFAIIIQHDARWFVVSASNGGEDLAYLILPSGALDLVGEVTRLDQRLGHARPLQMSRIKAEAWPGLHAAVPAYPVKIMPHSENADWRESYAQLAELVRNAFFWMDKIPGALRYVAAAERIPGNAAWGSLPGGWRSIAADGKYATLERYGHKPYSDQIKELGASFQLLDSIVSLLEWANWRCLFSRTVMTLAASDSLALMVREGENWIIAAETAVLALTSEGELRLAGACDPVSLGNHAGRGTIHLFEGRSLAPPEAHQ